MQVAETSAAASGCRFTNDGAEVRAIRSFAELEPLRGCWKGWPGHYFSDIDVQLTVMKSRVEVLRPHVLALYRNSDLDAILVGRLERKRLTLKVGYLTLFDPEVRCITFVYDAIRGNASPENTRLLVNAVTNCLAAGEADLAMFEFVPLGSLLYRIARELPGLLTRDSCASPQKHLVMTVPEDSKEVYDRMSHARRKDLRRKMRRFEAHPAGEPTIVYYRDPSEVDRLMRDAEFIASKTYQRGMGVGFANSDQVRARLELGAQQSLLRGYVLYVGGRPCAFWIGMLYGTTFVGEYTGYDPEFGEFSPGMFLMMRVIEGFCHHAKGDTVQKIDFGLGEAEYKNALCTDSCLEAIVYVFSPSVRGFTLKCMRTLTWIADASIRRVLTSAKNVARIKKLWRNRMAQRAAEHPETIRNNMAST
jgi:hypothetical protein